MRTGKEWVREGRRWEPGCGELRELVKGFGLALWVREPHRKVGVRGRVEKWVAQRSRQLDSLVGRERMLGVR